MSSAETVSAALQRAASRLTPVSDTARLDAELLMAHALGVSRDAMLLYHLGKPSSYMFEALIERRLAYEPVAYIVGRRAFWTIELEVGEGVLIPRPDSETLIEAAVAHFGEVGPKSILDLGTGPGTLLLAALDQWQDAKGLGVDQSDIALGYARRNADRLGLSNRATFQQGNWAEGVSGPFDLLLCNPPYVEEDADLPTEVCQYEPASALFSGADGLDDLRKLAPVIGGLIAPGGLGLFEIGYNQGAAASDLLGVSGLQVSVLKDLAGRDRCIMVNRR